MDIYDNIWQFVYLVIESSKNMKQTQTDFNLK